MKFERIKAGETYYDCHRERMGHTTMTRWGVWRVQIISVDAETQTAVVRWNGNPPKVWCRAKLERLRLTDQPPQPRKPKAKPAPAE